MPSIKRVICNYRSYMSDKVHATAQVAGYIGSKFGVPVENPKVIWPEIADEEPLFTEAVARDIAINSVANESGFVCVPYWRDRNHTSIRGWFIKKEAI